MDWSEGEVRMDVIHVGGEGPCAVRATHNPSGLTVTIDDQPTTKENWDRAKERLVALLAE